ncbi:SPOR domain-containing protein [Agromyces intestinalis]|uniref:SPOR domain-containing protein n=1 Tax=Agromyces intestinalis TaxID=2592652 RepID=A0A5C1YCH9_9MICO|nr:SPOR domain-containing protein [Agromyces intestinalis]QEO13055.1 SPOR domain-containing protein [Agromyces intestinalis]
MVDDIEHAYWYNMRTGEVEHGLLSPSADRVGPFQTRAEAERALEKLRENSAKWAEEDAADA